MQIRRLPLTHPHASALVEAVQQTYVERYGSPDETPVDPTEFEDPEGAFYVGYDGEEPVASGAWRRRSMTAFGTSAVGELKRMYVVPGHQRRGLATQMLRHLEHEALLAGLEAMVLETGTEQPEAIAFYERSGYVEIPAYGFYADQPECRCFGRLLAEAAAS